LAAPISFIACLPAAASPDLWSQYFTLMFGPPAALMCLTASAIPLVIVLP